MDVQEKSHPLTEMQRMILLNLIKEKSQAIIDKSQNPDVLERKKKAWIYVRDTFNAMNPHDMPRTEVQLRRAFEHVKRRVKLEQKKHRKMVLKMGGQHVSPPKFTKDRAIAASIMEERYAMINDIFEIFTRHVDADDSSVEEVSTKEEDLQQDPVESTDPLLPDNVTASPIVTSDEPITITTTPTLPIFHYIAPSTNPLPVVPITTASTPRYVPITTASTPPTSSVVDTSATSVVDNSATSAVDNSATVASDAEQSVKRPGKRKKVDDEFHACRERQVEHHSLKMKQMEEHHNALMKEHEERMIELKLKRKQEELRFKEQELKLEEQKKKLVEQETRLRLFNFAEEAAKFTLERLKQSFNKLDDFLDSGNSAYHAMSKSYE